MIVRSSATGSARSKIYLSIEARRLLDEAGFPNAKNRNVAPITLYSAADEDRLSTVVKGW